MTKKLLDFKASISDVKQVNPLFSSCKVRVLYTGRNRNMSILTRDAVEKALPTLKNIPIVGEFNESNSDYKGHGGAIDLESYKYIHTTKPYGVVPESATYTWEEVKIKDGSTREYLTIEGCYLWTGRYEEAYSIIENGKGQSMEIEVSDGTWVEEDEAYRIDNFVFSALCILGDDVEPAFEDAKITAYSLDKDSFKVEFSNMLTELESSLSEQEEKEMDLLKELLEKYSLTVEELTAKGIDFNAISEDKLEAKILEVFEIEVEVETNVETNAEDDAENEVEADDEVEVETNTDVEVEVETEVETETNVVDLEARVKELEGELSKANDLVTNLNVEVDSLREFKLNVEKSIHEDEVNTLFTNFQLTDEEVADIDIHAFNLSEIEEKCYSILGRKLAHKKDFSKQDEKTGIKLPLLNEKNKENDNTSGYDDLFEKFNKN